MTSLVSLKELLNSDTVRAVCWMLVHSLWQGLVFAAIAGLFLALTKRSRPAIRYQVLSVLFVLFILATVLTLRYEQQNFKQVNSQTTPQLSAVTIPAVPQLSSDQTGEPSPFPAVIAGFLSRQAPLIVALWLIILSLKTGNMIFNLGYTTYIRKRKARPADPYWVARQKLFCARLGIHRAVSLLESEIVKLPMVFGHLKPVIFIPLGLMAQLPPGQVEAILLHELAHIRRNDYLVNLLQNVVETLFFFNPALLWLSSRIREERENCCDEIAIGQTKDKKQFVAALISFRELSGSHAPVMAVAFPGNRNTLLNRVTRIVHRQNYTLNRVEKGSLVTCCLIAALLTLVFTQPTQSHPQKVIVARHQPVAAAITQLAAVKAPRPIIANKQVTADTLDKRKPSKDHNGSYERERALLLVADLVTEKIVPDTAAVASFGINGSGLTVNGQAQPEAVYQKFRAAYGITPQGGIYYDRQARIDYEHKKAALNPVQKPLAVRPFVPSNRQQHPAGQPLEPVVAQLTNDLVSSGILPDKSSLLSFKLTNTVLRVNGIKQPADLQARLRSKYLGDPSYPDDPHFGLHYDAAKGTMGMGISIDKDDP